MDIQSYGNVLKSFAFTNCLLTAKNCNSHVNVGKSYTKDRWRYKKTKKFRTDMDFCHMLNRDMMIAHKRSSCFVEDSAPAWFREQKEKMALLREQQLVNEAPPQDFYEEYYEPPPESLDVEPPIRLVQPEEKKQIPPVYISPEFQELLKLHDLKLRRQNRLNMLPREYTGWRLAPKRPPPPEPPAVKKKEGACMRCLSSLFCGFCKKKEDHSKKGPKKPAVKLIAHAVRDQNNLFATLHHDSKNKPKLPRVKPRHLPNMQSKYGKENVPPKPESDDAVLTLWQRKELAIPKATVHTDMGEVKQYPNLKISSRKREDQSQDRSKKNVSTPSVHYSQTDRWRFETKLQEAKTPSCPNKCDLLTPKNSHSRHAYSEPAITGARMHGGETKDDNSKVKRKKSPTCCPSLKELWSRKERDNIRPITQKEAAYTCQPQAEYILGQRTPIDNCEYWSKSTPPFRGCSRTSVKRKRGFLCFRKKKRKQDKSKESLEFKKIRRSYENRNSSDESDSKSSIKSKSKSKTSVRSSSRSKGIKSSYCSSCDKKSKPNVKSSRSSKSVNKSNSKSSCSSCCSRNSKSSVRSSRSSKSPRKSRSKSSCCSCCSRKSKSSVRKRRSRSKSRQSNKSKTKKHRKSPSKSKSTSSCTCSPCCRKQKRKSPARSKSKSSCTCSPCCRPQKRKSPARSKSKSPARSKSKSSCTCSPCCRSQKRKSPARSKSKKQPTKSKSKSSCTCSPCCRPQQKRKSPARSKSKKQPTKSKSKSSCTCSPCCRPQQKRKSPTKSKSKSSCTCSPCCRPQQKSKPPAERKSPVRSQSKSSCTCSPCCRKQKGSKSKTSLGRKPSRTKSKSRNSKSSVKSSRSKSSQSKSCCTCSPCCRKQKGSKSKTSLGRKPSHTKSKSSCGSCSTRKSKSSVKSSHSKSSGDSKAKRKSRSRSRDSRRGSKTREKTRSKSCCLSCCAGSQDDSKRRSRSRSRDREKRPARRRSKSSCSSCCSGSKSNKKAPPRDNLQDSEKIENEESVCSIYTPASTRTGVNDCGTEGVETQGKDAAQRRAAQRRAAQCREAQCRDAHGRYGQCPVPSAEEGGGASSTGKEKTRSKCCKKKSPVQKEKKKLPPKPPGALKYTVPLNLSPHHAMCYKDANYWIGVNPSYPQRYQSTAKRQKDAKDSTDRNRRKLWKDDCPKAQKEEKFTEAKQVIRRRDIDPHHDRCFTEISSYDESDGGRVGANRKKRLRKKKNGG